MRLPTFFIHTHVYVYFCIFLVANRRDYGRITLIAQYRAVIGETKMKLGAVTVHRPSTEQVTVAYCQRYHTGSVEGAENVIDVCGDTKTYLRCVDYSDKGSSNEK